jgi:hypothetical protein
MGFKTRSGRGKPEVKTLENDASVAKYIASIGDLRRRAECKLVLKMMGEISGEPPKMWGASIVGFGRYHYKYASGREGDWMRIGFSSRKKTLTVYSMAGFKKMKPILKRLGPTKHSVSCLYIDSLDDLDTEVLRELLQLFWDEMAACYPMD